MIFDSNLLFSDAQAITAAAASTNVIDLGATGKIVGASAALARDVGKGQGIPLLVQVVEGFNNLTTLAVSLQADDNSSFSSPKTVWTATLALADLKAGKVVIPEYIPRGTDERFLRLFYGVTGTAPTTGKITAGVTMGNQSNG